MTDVDVVYAYAQFLGLRPDDVRMRVLKSGKPFGRLYVNSEKIFNDLSKFAVTFSKSIDSYKYPIGVDDRGYLLGLYDSEGSVSIRNAINIAGRAGFVEAVAERINALGFKAHVYRSSVVNNIVYKRIAVLIGHGNLAAFVKWLYDDQSLKVCAKRKFERILECHSGLSEYFGKYNYANPEPSSLNT
jgi:hypothetical protein